MSNRDNHTDVAIIGGGIVGSVAAYECTKAGLKPRLIEKGKSPYSDGASWGHRMLRLANATVRDTDAAIRSAKLYHEMQIAGNELVKRPDNSDPLRLIWPVEYLTYLHREDQYPNNGKNFLDATQTQALAHNLPHRDFTARDLATVRETYKQLNFDNNFKGAYSEKAFLIDAGQIVRTAKELARLKGALLHDNEEMLDYEQTPEGRIKILTATGEYTADKIIIAAGIWTKKFLPEKYRPFIDAFKQEYYIYDIPGYRPDLMGVAVTKYEYFYFLPEKDGLKIAVEQIETPVDLDKIERLTTPDNELDMNKLAGTNFKGGPFKPVKKGVCHYAGTKDGAGMVGFHPDAPNIIFAVDCEGRGAKKAAANAESIVQGMIAGVMPPQLFPSRLERFDDPWGFSSPLPVPELENLFLRPERLPNSLFNPDQKKSPDDPA